MKRLSHLWKFATKETTGLALRALAVLLYFYILALVAGVYIVGLWFPDVLLTSTAYWLTGVLVAVFIALAVWVRWKVPQNPYS
jgi:uncharacterized membrane protein YiaA